MKHDKLLGKALFSAFSPLWEKHNCGRNRTCWDDHLSPFAKTSTPCSFWVGGSASLLLPEASSHSHLRILDVGEVRGGTK